jgi:Domain of unknown function (DUF4145)
VEIRQPLLPRNRYPQRGLGGRFILRPSLAACRLSSPTCLALPCRISQHELCRPYWRCAKDIEELPSDPPSLRIAYKQAVRAIDANANLAAAAMFRRALQIITRELLGAKPGNLANELKEVVGKKYNGAAITKSFASIGYVIKEAGNQGAHPDKDPDLLDFTSQDAQDLQDIFMEIVAELFIIPAAKEKAHQEFLARRKIVKPTTQKI